MPFPLAHPAAVLPLRRFCKDWLNFPALVIGTLVPDSAYLLRNPDISTLSHQLAGSLMFGLPVGWLMLVVLYGLCRFAVEKLSGPQGRMFYLICQRPIGSIWLATFALMIGIWSHVFWDSFTHGDGWITGQLAILQTPVFEFAGRTAKLCHVLWYVSTFAGVGSLFIAFENWKWNAQAHRVGAKSKSIIQDAALMTLLVIPVSVIHHLVRNPVVFAMTGVFCVILTIIFFVKMTRSQRKARR